MPRSLPEDPIIRGLVLQARRAQLTRRSMLGVTGGAAAALALAACAPGGQAASRRPAKDLSDTEKIADLGELARLPRRRRGRQLPDPGALHRRDRHRGRLPRRHRRQQLLLREGQRPARARAGHRRRPGLPHRLDGQPLHPLRLHAGARPRQHPEHREPQPRPAEHRLRRGTQAVPSVAGRLRRHLLEQGGGPGRAALGERPLGPGAQGPRRRAERDARHDGPHHARAGHRHLGRLHGRRSSRPRSRCSSEQVESGQIRNIKGNSYLEDLQNGDTLAAICWSGDITVINAEAGDKWEFIIPEAGGTLWNDNFLIPIGSPHKKNAETLMNYYYDPAGRRGGRRLGELHHPGRRRQGRGREDRSGARREPADLPERRDAVAGAACSAPSTPAQEQAYQQEFQAVLLGA